MWTTLLNFLDSRTPYLFHFLLMGEEIGQTTQFSIKAYHGCWRVNENSTRKLIYYKRGEKCLFPTNNRHWGRAKAIFIRQTLLNSLKSKN